VGSYNFNNCAAAALIGQYFGVPAPAVKAALESYIPSNNRSQLIDKSGYRILLDAYNANPSSMKAALDNFELMEGREKTVFLGDMFELGSTSPEEHQQIADLVAAKGFQQVYLIGENFSGVQTALKTFKGYPEFEAFIKKHKPPVGNILIKGSRGMALERVLDSL
jgi:UDP-N-acetylmuramoyl-tripeptide--D-alanyl-D-alanine ligase